MCFIEWGYAVFEALRYKPESSGCDIRRGNGNICYLFNISAHTNGGPVRRVNNLINLSTVWKFGESQPPGTLGPVEVCNGIPLPSLPGMCLLLVGMVYH
jgi:hypothetical protein